MEFSIQRIIEEMQDFQKEMHNEFKDGKIFWKHFYKKLDKEIYKEFQKIVETKEEPPKEQNNNQIKDIFTNEIIDINSDDIYKLRIIREDTLIVKYFKGLDNIKKEMIDSRYKEYCGVFYLFDVD